MKRIMPSSRITPMDTSANYWERVIRLHFREVNHARPSRGKVYFDSLIYAAVIIFLFVLFGIFGDPS